MFIDTKRHPCIVDFVCAYVEANQNNWSKATAEVRIKRDMLVGEVLAIDIDDRNDLDALERQFATNQKSDQYFWFIHSWLPVAFRRVVSRGSVATTKPYVAIPEAGSALYIRDGKIWKAPLNADGSCSCDPDESIALKFYCEFMYPAPGIELVAE